jgi:riboflavin kinase
MAEDIELLLLLAESGTTGSEVEVRLEDLARALGCSRQTVHRRLVRLEKSGFIRRKLKGRRQLLEISERGRASLQALLLRLEKALRSTGSIRLTGTVTFGLGEGHYYMRIPHYMKQFEKVLGVRPYPGTLNVKLDGTSEERAAALREITGRVVRGFRSETRTFGDVKVFPARLNGTDVALIFPARSHHREVVEVISERNLRRSLGLKNGDRVELEVIV